MICNNKFIRDGTNQLERHSEFLKEGFIKIDERSHSDLLKFIYDLASKIAYYDSDNKANGNWQFLLKQISQPDSLEPSDEANSVPHIGLLIVLTKLFSYAQDELNNITQKHLEFYYNDILKIKKGKSTPDEVQLILSLAKSNIFDQYLLKTNTAFDAGKDLKNQSLIYETNKESVISRAKLQDIKSIFLDKVNGETKLLCAPSANSLDGLGTPLTEDKPYWSAFGESQLDKSVDNNTMINAKIGFAISTSILYLNEGHRHIEIDIRFTPSSEFSSLVVLHNIFNIYYSGEEEFIEPNTYKTEVNINPVENLWQLKLSLDIEVSQPPFTNFNSEVYQTKYQTDNPVLEIILKPDSLDYDIVKHLKIETVDINVDVSGMRNHLLQSNLGILNSESPFMPFTTQPTLNNRFYIGNSEIFGKKLKELSINLAWHDLTSNSLADHYFEYNDGSSTDIDNESFKVNIDVLLGNSWEYHLKENESIFNDTDAMAVEEIKILESEFNSSIDSEIFVNQDSITPIKPLSHKTQRGFMRMELIGPTAPFKAFGHKEFTRLYTERAIALATYDPASLDPQPILPLQPYTPTIKELTINYKAHKLINVKSQNDYDKLFQIGPFGFREIDNLYHSEIVPVIDGEGHMILGLNDFSAPQTLNLLFHIEEGTADRSIVLEEENINWYYMSNNRWIGLSPQELLADGTLGFKQSGIISLVVPQNATSNNSFLPSDKFWIKAVVTNGAEGANKVISIFPNAVNAVLRMDDQNFDEHLNSLLEIDTISSLLTRVKEIKSVTQPLQSNKGYPSESSLAYSTRISERLRHKNRAVQHWDFEHMILKKFPNIFKVKCLAHTNPESEQKAGDITLIIVSNLRNKDAVNPFEPSTSISVLQQVENYIRQFISPFISVHVELPVYESILVDAKIGFNTGFDPGFYSAKLNEELKQYLSPWAFTEGVDIEIGGAIYKSSILQFIESKEYVDYVVDFKLYHRYSNTRKIGISEMEIDLDFEVAKTIYPGIGDMAISNNFIIGQDVNIACAKSARSILVSALDHRIQALRPDEHVCSGLSTLGIGFMTVNLDLVVNE